MQMPCVDRKDNSNNRYCDPLDALCILTGAIQHHLASGNYINRDLGALFTGADRELIITHPEIKIPTNDARPRITAGMGDIEMAPMGQDSLSTEGLVSFRLGAAYDITISTASLALTDALRIELAYLLILSVSNMREIGLHLAAQSLRVSKTIQGRPDHPNFYVASISIPVEFSPPVWKTEGLSSMLREIQTSLAEPGLREPLSVVTIK